MSVTICGDFVCVCNMYLIRIDKTLKWNKFDYIVDDRKIKLVKGDIEEDRYCILITQVENNTEVIQFNDRTDRDNVFDRIMAVLKYVRG